jgi:hypothetical protein
MSLLRPRFGVVSFKIRDIPLVASRGSAPNWGTGSRSWPWGAPPGGSPGPTRHRAPIMRKRPNEGPWGGPGGAPGGAPGGSLWGPGGLWGVPGPHPGGTPPGAPPRAPVFTPQRPPRGPPRTPPGPSWFWVDPRPGPDDGSAPGTPPGGPPRASFGTPSPNWGRSPERRRGEMVYMVKHHKTTNKRRDMVRSTAKEG